MEAAHIVDESEGGSNEADNGIPVCFDCHQEIGAYNDKHPRGNKIRPEELKARRDRIYHFVDTGVIYAQIVAARVRSVTTDVTKQDLDQVSLSSTGSREAQRFLSVLQSRSTDAPAQKLMLFNEQDRAWILDQLLASVPDNVHSISTLAAIVQNPAFAHHEALLILENMVRSVTLYGDSTSKAEMLRVNPKILATAYEGLRLALFEDLITVVRRDQFDEVNEIVPVLVDHVDGIPIGLLKQYVLMLADQARSSSYKGAPAARRALLSLPAHIAKLGLDAMDSKFLAWNSRYDHIIQFVKQYKHLANANQLELFEDVLTLSQKDFLNKYFYDD
jgi:hypothetical protein